MPLRLAGQKLLVHVFNFEIRQVAVLQDVYKRQVDPSIDESLIKYVEDRMGHDRRYGIDPAKIKNELGWYPETTFEVGLEPTINWYLEPEDWMNNVTSGDYQKYYAEMYKTQQTGMQKRCS